LQIVRQWYYKYGSIIVTKISHPNFYKETIKETIKWIANNSQCNLCGQDGRLSTLLYFLSLSERILGEIQQILKKSNRTFCHILGIRYLIKIIFLQS
jgi:hypothetical protein